MSVPVRVTRLSTSPDGGEIISIVGQKSEVQLAATLSGGPRRSPVSATNTRMPDWKLPLRVYLCMRLLPRRDGIVSCPLREKPQASFAPLAAGGSVSLEEHMGPHTDHWTTRRLSTKQSIRLVGAELLGEGWQVIMFYSAYDTSITRPGGER